MKTLIVIVAALYTLVFQTGCQSVAVSVNSIKNMDNLSKDTPVVFVKINEDIESEKLRRQCMKGAQAAGVNVTSDCGSNCYWATVEGQAGSSKERTSSFYNPYTRQTQVRSSNVTERKMKIKLFGEAELKKILYQSVLDSSGSSSNVLSVAEEMCEAAFKAFPKESTNELFSVWAR